MFHQINFSDLDFERTRAVFYSTRGVAQVRSLQVGMPRIPQKVINGVFYLYWSREDALAGRNPGGTGFIVKYEGENWNREVLGNHFYGVTNWHVACRGCSTIRLNTIDGGTDIIELDPSEWHFLPGKCDVAVVPLSLNGQIHDVASVSTHQFVANPGTGSRRYVNAHIGVGDDVFMVGLFVDHGGVAKNVPSARFGNVSMLANPQATIKQPTGHHGESYVIDMHSRTGFSGSPVYAYRTFGSDLTDTRGVRFDELQIDQFRNLANLANEHFPSHLSGYIRAPQMFALLGIHWGQFPERWELRDKSSLAESRKDLITEGGYVEGMSGMTCVIPAWQIFEVLNLPELTKLRQPEIDRGEEERRKLMAKHRPMQPKAESAEPKDTQSNGENPHSPR